MTQDELNQILADHAMWLKNSFDGKRADLSGADLSGADLSGANLSGANLSGADLSNANLSNADLSGANLSGADLSNANLRSAILSNADLRSANLRSAILRSAILSGAELATLVETRSIVPESGSFECYKQVAGYVILRLMVPADAQRVGGLTHRKCRASSVTVLDATNMDGTPAEGDVFPNKSTRYGKIDYKIGETFTVADFDPDPREVCTAGIHFFMNRQEAATYDWS